MLRFIAFWMLFSAVALADPVSNSVPAVNTPVQGSSVASAVLPGTYTIATLPTCNTTTQAKYAFDTDLGGGADMVLCDGTYWKHIRMGVVTPIAAASSITITPLASAPIEQFTGGGTLTSMNVNIVTNAALSPGYTIELIFPNGVVAAAATVGVSVGGGTATSLGNLAGYWEILQYNGTTMVELQKGLL